MKNIVVLDSKARYVCEKYKTQSQPLAWVKFVLSYVYKYLVSFTISKHLTQLSEQNTW